MNIDKFQQDRLDAYFKTNASDEIKARRVENKMTIKGAYEWIKTKLQKTIGEEATLKGDVVIGDDQWCYNEMIHYFTMCKEGDIYRTGKEIEEEAERQTIEIEKRRAKAAKLREAHRERVKRWAEISAEEIAADIRRARYVKKHSWLEGKTAEVIDKAIADEATRKEEAERKAAEKKAKYAAKREREEEQKRKTEERAAKEAEKQKIEESQLTLF